MLQSELNQLADAPTIDSDWKRLCRLGGVAALILLLYSVATMIVLVAFGTPPATAAESFDMLQSNRLVGLLRLDILTVFVYMPFCYLLYLGIYVALKRTNVAFATLSTVLIFAGITLFLATPSALSMAVLSDKYAVATTDAQRSQLLAAGEAILASDMWHGTGAFLGGMLLQSGAVLISFVMLSGRIRVFSKATAYVGILTHGLDLAHYVCLLVIPAIGNLLLPVAGTLYLIWFPLVGLGLSQLGRDQPGR